MAVGLDEARSGTWALLLVGCCSPTVPSMLFLFHLVLGCAAVNFHCATGAGVGVSRVCSEEPPAFAWTKARWRLCPSDAVHECALEADLCVLVPRQVCVF